MRRHSSFYRHQCLLFGLLIALITACSNSGEESATSVADSSADASEPVVAAQDAEFEPSGGDEGDAIAAEESVAEPAADSDGDDSGSNENADTATDQGRQAAANTSGEIGAAPLAATQQTAADLGRKIVFTADIVVEVEDVTAAGREATDAIAQLGGFVFGQQTEGGIEPRSTLTFKVLPEDFDAAIAALGSVGELVSQTVSADDVTERVVDLETRIEVAQLGVDRLRAALSESQSLEDYAELERLLLERESELEVMRGSLRTLQDRIDLATITVTLVQDAVNHSLALQVTRYDTHDGAASCPGDFGSEGSIESGTETTICLEIINTGDEPVADLTIIDTALDITSADDVITVFGDLGRLEAGQSLMVAHEFQADRAVRLRPKVTARPITIGDGGAIEPAGPPIDVRADGFIEVFEPDAEPGFGDGFGAGLSVLSGLWTFLVVSLGFIVPLLIPMTLIAAALWTVRKRVGSILPRRRRHQNDSRATPPPPPSPPDVSDQKLVETVDD